MITVINGTNRKGNLTQIFAKAAVEIFKSKTDEEVKYLDLEEISGEILHASMYDGKVQSEQIIKLQDECFSPANKIVFIIPEYNGSYPGIVKLFLDAISVRNYTDTFKGKKVAMIGTASGRAGNLRGIDHLIGVCQHVGMTAYPKNLPISSIKSVLNENSEINDGTMEAMNGFADGFLAF